MITTLLSVALGGACGATLRFLFGLGLIKMTGPTSFPVAIISVNVIGSFLMGIFVVLAAQRGLTYLSPFVMTGVLGGFTTFSAFSLEAMTLYERGDVGLAALYVVASVVCSILGLAAGLLVARSVFA
ncbi:MAG: fluoride efflux transporter CrcB [Pseudomonadota bacterium]